VSIDEPVALRAIPDPPGIATARTLPAAWYADAAFHEHELQRVFRTGWVCAGVTDELPAPASWTARTVGGVPMLFVRDRDGGLRVFLNVCRHRAAPLCDDGDAGSGSLIRCPYHAWIYRHDGTLAKASGVGSPAGFDLADYALKPVAVAVWRRFVFVHVADASASLELGPLAASIDATPIEGFDLVAVESDLRAFNWKVLLENYSENYHTPFVHPEIDTSSSEDYPMVGDGPVLYAWDRHLRPGSADDARVRAERLPGEPGWERLFTASTARAYDVGSYLTVWPNLMINVFPDAMLAMWIEPVGPVTTRVERRLYVVAGCAPDRRDAIVAAHRLVHQQDVEICVRVQRSHSAGLDADGVLATVEERGVYFVHEHLRAALASDSPKAAR
jgi:phenylpropionate dioxygenase-like ring-hydroxylating dioxygenase large terminal subunit